MNFKIKEHIGIIGKFPSGWNMELNKVSWNEGETKYDIRSWDLSHERMTRGIVLKEEHMRELYRLLKERFEREERIEDAKFKLKAEGLDEGLTEEELTAFAEKVADVQPKWLDNYDTYWECYWATFDHAIDEIERNGGK